MQPVPTVPLPITSPARTRVPRDAYAIISPNDQYRSARLPRLYSSPLTSAAMAMS